MDAQLVLSLLLIGVAAAYLVRRGIRAWQPPKSGCTGGCGCSKATTANQQPALIAPEQLTLRQRPKSSSNHESAKDENTTKDRS